MKIQTLVSLTIGLLAAIYLSGCISAGVRSTKSESTGHSDAGKKFGLYLFDTGGLDAVHPSRYVIPPPMAPYQPPPPVQYGPPPPPGIQYNIPHGYKIVPDVPTNPPATSGSTSSTKPPGEIIGSKIVTLESGKRVEFVYVQAPSVAPQTYYQPAYQPVAYQYPMYQPYQQYYQPVSYGGWDSSPNFLIRPIINLNWGRSFGGGHHGHGHHHNPFIFHRRHY